MIAPGEYAWKGNNRYGDNHRHLTLIASPKSGELVRFEHKVVHSAGFMGKDFSILSGTVRVLAPDRLELVAEKNEHITVMDDDWSEAHRSDQRLVFVAVKKRLKIGPKTFELDGEPYVAVEK